MIKVGFGITFVWCIIICFLCWTNWNDIPDMKLSDWGSFLSGSTSPIALLWLVIGYLMQNKELNMNRNALKTQIEALQVQTEAAQVQAAAAKVQANEISRQQIIRVLGKNWEQ